MTSYATKHNRADIVLTRNLDEGLTPLAMWGAMETIHQKYAPRFRRRPVCKPTIRMEVSPSLDETRGWTLEDWHQYAIQFLEELERVAHPRDSKHKGADRFNLERAQLFACLHHDAKSGIPHLHILINRIDLDGNLINDSFIGQRATRAAHAINVKRGWELPEDIHNAHVQEVSAACLSVLEKMPRYSWSAYKRHLELLGYKVKEQRDKQGVLHGYTVMRGNSRFKSSILGTGRNLMASRLEGTWRNLHPVPKVVQQAPAVTPHRPTVVDSRTAQRPVVAQSTPDVPSVFARLLSVNGKDYSIEMPMETYKAMDEAIEVNSGDATHDDILNVALLLFRNYVDAATAMSESSGGGGSTPSGWGKDKDEDDRDWARRCARHASWLCKPIRRRRTR